MRPPLPFFLTFGILNKYSDINKMGVEMKNICILISLIILIVQVNTAYAENKKQVLIIHSYHPEFEWVSDCTAGINSILDNKYQIFDFYMNTKRLPSSKFKTRADLAWKKFESLKPDLVMVGDDNALKFLGKRLVKQKTPVVYFGINNNPRIYFNYDLPKNVTGVLERTPIAHGMTIFSTLIPSAKKVLLMMDKTPTSDADIENTFKGKAGTRLLEYLQSNDWEVWKKAVRKSKEKYDALLIGTYYTVKDKQGKIVPYKDIIKWITNNSPLPNFGYARWSVESGQTAAFVTEGRHHGELAGGIVLDILEKGKSPSSIFPKYDNKVVIHLSRKELDRFGITVPPKILRDAIME